jgi:tRNA(Ile)-lysidine synthase
MNDFTLIVKNKFLSALNEYSMTDGVSHIVVGFSGGADSLCLLHLLNGVKNDFGFNIVAAHVNHGIRGDEAVKDADFCADFCKTQGIEFKLLEADCVALAEENGQSVEECGRQIRYEFFNSLCQNDAYRIATAHNANDNAETLLFNLARGTGLKGASGIPRVRGNIIRPIIFCTRDEIEGYCTENNLYFVTDSTNLCDEYTRNKIRHNALPVLAEVNSGAIKNITAFTEYTNEVCDLLSGMTQSAIKEAHISNDYYNADFLSSLHTVVKTECIIELFKRISDETLDRQKVKAVADLLLKKGRIQIYGNIYAECIKNEFRFFRNDNISNYEEIIVDFNHYSELVFNGYTINVTEYDNNLKIVNKNILDNLIDCDRIVGHLKLRTRREGDKITLINRKVSKSLKKLFNEKAIPLEERNKIPVLCDDCGVVWVYGVGTDNRVKVNNNSSNIIFVGGKTND